MCILCLWEGGLGLPVCGCMHILIFTPWDSIKTEHLSHFYIFITIFPCLVSRFRLTLRKVFSIP